MEENKQSLMVNLDLLPEVREDAALRNAAGKIKVAQRYNSRVKPRSMMAGDLVLRKKTPRAGDNKLSPNWEGPYRVNDALGNGAYHLEEIDGTRIPRSWNATHLRHYYS
jgi:hypothetical protein